MIIALFADSVYLHAIQEIAVFCRYTRDHDKRATAENLLKKFRDLSEDDCRELICDIQRNYRLPWKARTVGEMIAVARQESGNWKGMTLWHWNALTRK